MHSGGIIDRIGAENGSNVFRVLIPQFPCRNRSLESQPLRLQQGRRRLSYVEHALAAAFLRS